ncbi:penicillin acylase family protein [Georgenia sp. SYP-B2076]|uniref:penicillin acylase family protein n=1 Tax=Georgenia sp. SYP-B2076 TaxID=2495881 RepID=UPI000F8F5659|nr:penicillin acylase family protein [Georgenia sp. SYP-B2076]
MSVVRKAAIAVCALLVVVLVVAVGLATVLVRRPLPDDAGAETLDVLGAEVQVVRDGQGVPRIYASSDVDLMRAEGYVHAQDRFFEMDYRRHVASGRLSELVGPNERALAADQVVRTLGWRQVAEQEWEQLDDASRALYEAYAAGVNAYLDGREASRLGVEYTVLGMTTTLEAVEPWTPVDSLVWLKAMAWELSRNYQAELGRAAALRPLADNVTRVEELYPDYPYATNAPIMAPASAAPAVQSLPAGPSGVDGATVGAATAATDPATAVGSEPAAPAGRAAGPEPAAPAGRAAGPEPAPAAGPEPEPAAGAVPGGHAVQRALADASAAVSAVPVMIGEGEAIGSNSFVVAGAHTSTGKPMLANDPHLRLSAPGIWYQVGLHCTKATPECTFDVSGFSFSGMPGVIIGQNAHLAWGLTNLGADVMDLTLERVYDDGTYLRDGERVPLEQRRETIEVNGGDPVTVTVSSTVHGPIVSDVLPETGVTGTVPVPEGAPPAGFSGYVVALQWTALTPGRAGAAIFALDRAASAADVAAAAADLDVPSQNITFATADGDIGYQAAGRVPVRADVKGAPVPSDGSWPRPGWDSRYDWQGFVPPEAMPAELNPPEGFIVTANQAVTTPGSGPFLTGDWDPGYRAARIRTLLEERIAGGRPFDVGAMNAVMLDDVSPFGPVLVPDLLHVDVEDAFVAQAVDLLRTWSANGYPTGTDSPGAAYFNAVWANLLRLTFADDLPASEAPDGGARWLQVVQALMKDPENPWWDDRTTVNIVEGRDEILRQALVGARHQLTNSLGKNPAEWRWGKMHEVRLTHPVLGGPEAPEMVRRLVNPSPVEVPGGAAVVNAMSYNASAHDDLGRGDYTVADGPSMRMVVDLGDRDASTWVVTTGVSGHPGSTHYTDQTAAWAAGETFPWPGPRAAAEHGARETLTLRPPE